MGKTNWTPEIGDRVEMRPRPAEPPLVIPYRDGRLSPNWRRARVDEYLLGLFNDGDLQMRPIDEKGAVGEAVQREGARGELRSVPKAESGGAPQPDTARLPRSKAVALEKAAAAAAKPDQKKVDGGKEK